MPNVLRNVLQTSGLKGQQPWRQYYQGIKPQNPLGKVVRRMGNKVKNVVPATTTRTMQFSYMTANTALFGVPPVMPYLEDYVYGGRGGRNRYGVPYRSPEQRMRDDRRDLRQYQTDKRASYSEARRTVSDVRATYRTGLDTLREAKNIYKLLQRTGDY